MRHRRISPVVWLTAAATLLAAIAAPSAATAAAVHRPSAGCPGRPEAIRLPGLGFGGAALAAYGGTVVGEVYTNRKQTSGYPAIWQHGRLTVLRSLADGWAADINSHGEIVGNSGNDSAAWAMVHGRIHLLRGRGSFRYARRVNDSGQIAGFAFGGNDAARWDSYAAAPAELRPAPGDSFSTAKGLNNRGQAAGDSDNARGVPRPAIWNPAGQVRLLPSAFGEGQPGTLYWINNDGRSAGESLKIDQQGNILADQATVWSAAGRPRLVPLLPGYNQSTALGMAQDGTVAGESASFDYSTGQVSAYHALVWFGHGPARTLPVPGVSYAGSVSNIHVAYDNGTAVGTAGSANQPPAAYVWTCISRQAFVPPAGSPAASRERAGIGAGRPAGPPVPPMRWRAFR